MPIENLVAVAQPKSIGAKSSRRDAVGAEIPVTVHASRTNQGLGESLPPVHEDTKTVIVLQQGAVVRLTATLMTDETVVLTNRMTGADVLCRVGNVKSQPGIQHYVDLEFIQRAPGFWGDSAAASSAPIATNMSTVEPVPTTSTPAAVLPTPPVPVSAPVSAPPAPPVTAIAPPAPPSVVVTPSPPPAPPPVADAPSPVATKALELAPLAEHVAGPWKASQEGSVTPIRRNVSQSTFGPIIAEGGSTRTSGSHKALLATAAAVLLLLSGAAGGYWFYAQQNATSAPAPQQAASLPPIQASPDPAETSIVTDSPPTVVSTPEPESQMDVIVETRPPVDVSPVRSAPPPVPAARASAPVQAPAVRRKTVPVGQLQASKAKTVVKRVDATVPPPAIVGVVSLADTGAANSLLISEPAGPAPPPVISQSSVGGQLRPPQVITSTPPVYPPVARTQRVQGVVELDVLVDETGKVVETKVIAGPALLLSAAQQAVGRWRYKPAQMNGKPVTAHTKVSVRFNLQ